MRKQELSVRKETDEQAKRSIDINNNKLDRN